MADFGKAFDALADTEYWMEVAMAFVGFMGSVLVRALVEGRLGQDLPNAVYGVPAIVGGLSMDRMMVAFGGGLYAVDELTMQAEVQETLVNIVGGA